MINSNRICDEHRLKSILKIHFHYTTFYEKGTFFMSNFLRDFPLLINKYTHIKAKV